MRIEMIFGGSIRNSIDAPAVARSPRFVTTGVDARFNFGYFSFSFSTAKGAGGATA